MYAIIWKHNDFYAVQVVFDNCVRIFFNEAKVNGIEDVSVVILATEY
jgi:hypothetical protein